MSDSHDLRGDPRDAAASLHRLWLLAYDLKNSFSLLSHAFHELPRHLSDSEHARQSFTDLQSLLTHVDFLATSLIDTLGRRAAGRTAVSINDFLTEREAVLNRTLCPGITLSIRPSASGGVVLASVDEFERLLLALVSNACMAMPDGGKLTISTSWLDHGASATRSGAWPRRYLRLTVGDTGDGLDRAGHLRLLDPIPGDVPAADAERHSIVSAVRRLHGWLIVESEEGGGTRVHVCLPAVAEPPDVGLPLPA